MLPENFEIVTNPPQKIWQELATQINSDVGWNMSFHDYQSFLTGYGPDNFKFLAVIDKATGKAVSCMYGTKLSREGGSPPVFSIGMYYTHPDYRTGGLGLGRRLFDEWANFANGGNRFLTSVPEMAEKYAERSGFDKSAPWQLMYMGAKAKDCDISQLFSDSTLTIVDFDGVAMEKLDEYDRCISGGIVRIHFLKKWLVQPEAYNKFAISPEGNIIGYCNARISHRNHVILGPFYAENAKIASTLLRRTLEEVPNFSQRTKLIAYGSSDNNNGLELFKKMVGGEVDTELYPRMFTNEVVHSQGDKVYSFADSDTSLN
ncbi:hypothetical protein QR680_015420 [Steinernema hermaphroditum]|uniref:YitH/HolE acetyltransferase (GNAT) domain-containing protein n=1 Tax=Steinernema hermaphroditum TaxID=289476 RepID=A0AA39H7V9_9BILA|nr:hypothetical protein QR680_015420 [Steinernema hermaphroditum]